MVLKENPKYRTWRYSNKDSVNSNTAYSSEINPVMHKQFETRGEHNFGGLELRGLGWKKVHPLYDQEEEIISIIEKDGSKADESKIPHSKRYNPHKTLVYSNEQAVVIMSIDRENNYHEIDITLKKYSERNIQYIEDTKRMLENLLKCKLTEKENKNEPSSGLIGRIEKN